LERWSFDRRHVRGCEFLCCGTSILSRQQTITILCQTSVSSRPWASFCSSFLHTEQVLLFFFCDNFGHQNPTATVITPYCDCDYPCIVISDVTEFGVPGASGVESTRPGHKGIALLLVWHAFGRNNVHWWILYRVLRIGLLIVGRNQVHASSLLKDSLHLSWITSHWFECARSVQIIVADSL
jgi:hypothetical protein